MYARNAMAQSKHISNSSIKSKSYKFYSCNVITLLKNKMINWILLPNLQFATHSLKLAIFSSQYKLYIFPGLINQRDASEGQMQLFASKRQQTHFCSNHNKSINVRKSLCSDRLLLTIARKSS